MVTPTPSSAPQAGEPLALPPTQAAWKAAVHVPSPAPGAARDGGATSAPWQRVDAAWPVILNSPSGLDGEAQRLVRRVLTQAAGKRLFRRRELGAARLWMWQPQPHLADYTRQRRFYGPGLYHFPPLELFQMLGVEARLALEVIITPPGTLGSAEVWQELVALQCQRIGQLHAALQSWLGAARAQQALQGILEGLVC